MLKVYNDHIRVDNDLHTHMYRVRSDSTTSSLPETVQSIPEPFTSSSQHQGFTVAAWSRKLPLYNITGITTTLRL